VNKKYNCKVSTKNLSGCLEICKIGQGLTFSPHPAELGRWTVWKRRHKLPDLGVVCYGVMALLTLMSLSRRSLRCCLRLFFTAQCTLVHLRGLGIACRLSVRLSVCLSVTLVICDHIGWKSWKLIAQTISPAPSLFVAKRRPTYSQGNMGKFWGD